MNIAAGLALIAAAMMTQPPNVALLAMGALALAQGGADSDAADQSATTALASVKDTSTLPIAPPANPTLNKGTAGFSDKKLAEAKSLLADAGYKLNADGVISPDGKFTSGSSLGSAGGMASAGMSPEAIKEAQKVLGALNSEMNGGGSRVSGMGVSEGGGSGSPGGNGGPEFQSNDANGVGHGLFGNGMNSAQKALMVAGKTVTFDGDPIGVKGQDIFEMVHVAYERKRQTNHFIDQPGGETQTASLRAPASVSLKSANLRPASLKPASLKAIHSRPR